MVWLLIVLLAAMSVEFYVIAADRKRYLVRFDLEDWEWQGYLRALPNFLETLHEHRFRTPWPRRANAVAAAFFRFRLGTMRGRRRAMRSEVVRRHLALHALLEILRPFISDFILDEQQRIVHERVAVMPDTAERDRLIAFLDAVYAYRVRFHAQLSRWERRTLVQMVQRRFMATLRHAHCVFQEHGYTLLPELTQLRQWESMSGVEVAQDLPAIPAASGTHTVAPSGRLASGGGNYSHHGA